MSLRGKGLECPVLPDPGLLAAESAGDTDAPRAEDRRPELPELVVVAGDELEMVVAPPPVPAAPGLMDKPG